MSSTEEKIEDLLASISSLNEVEEWNDVKESFDEAHNLNGADLTKTIRKIKLKYDSIIDKMSEIEDIVRDELYIIQKNAMR